MMNKELAIAERWASYSKNKKDFSFNEGAEEMSLITSVQEET